MSNRISALLRAAALLAVSSVAFAQFAPPAMAPKAEPDVATVAPSEDDENDWVNREITFDSNRGSLTSKAGTAGKFDYYLLAMSWSPNYCLTHANETQCIQKKTFVIHGLWPENLSGIHPSSCPSQYTLTQSAIDIVFPYSPSKSLIQHEWDKHGVCAGKSSTAYETDAVNAFKSVKVPSYLVAPTASKTVSLTTLRSDFQRSSGLTSSQFVVTCNGSKLKEVRVCFNKQFAAQTCGSDIVNSCPTTLTIDAPK
jgi:ribonuclease T2